MITSFFYLYVLIVCWLLGFKCGVYCIFNYKGVCILRAMYGLASRFEIVVQMFTQADVFNFLDFVTKFPCSSEVDTKSVYTNLTASVVNVHTHTTIVNQLKVLLPLDYSIALKVLELLKNQTS